MERIVLGYDGGPASLSALEWTAARARRGVTEVDVVLVVPPFVKDHSSELRRLHEAEGRLLDRVPDLHVAVHRLEGGVTKSIARAAEDADLVVVGISPGHPIRAAAAGWMPLRLSTRAVAPVCMIPAGWTETGDPVTVGIAIDESSDAALAFGAAEAVAASKDLRLVHSWLMPTPSFDSPAIVVDVSEGVIEQHRQALDRAVRSAMSHHPPLSVQGELVRDSRSAGLLRFDARSSLIVIGSHRRGVLISSLLGSVGQDILWRAECPICIVPPPLGESVVARTMGDASVAAHA